MNRLSHSQERILLSLAKYKYLTVSQLVEIGIMSDKRNVSKKVKELRQLKLLQSISYGFTPKIGRVENVNYLTTKGKKLIMEGLGMEEEEIRIPIGRANLFFKDYFHRRSTIDFHIHLNKWTKTNGSHLLFFDTYFDKTGNNRTGKNLRAKTRIEVGTSYVIPDVVFMIELGDLKKELYLLEVCNGKDTLKNLKQIKKHFEAMQAGSVNQHYEFEQPYRLLCVFEYPSMMKALMERIEKDDYFFHMKEHLFFKPIEDVHHSKLINQWQDFSGQEQTII
ncbi:MarR family transcriptional regulator [Bernardetia sp. OM2101]|uniref:MarR family transcriptional regulator n=1 Tax=Bernardetia sp. OM2101 TaxID=3344876 RepID=UPI0035D0005A